MQCEELNWQAADGAELFARCWRPTADPVGAICLIHGLGEHSGRYAEIAARYTEAGYAMPAFDLRGHGRSSGPRGHYSSFDAALDDIGLLLHHAGQMWPGRLRVLYGCTKKRTTSRSASRSSNSRWHDSTNCADNCLPPTAH